ncbi:MAG: hypothetical protein IT244_08930 [Bacteroidia bacterium]|nr:hypothetical protein [Bacteroidia bacterium]
MSYTLPPLAQKGQFFIFDESKIIDLFNTDCIGVKMIDYSKLLDVKNQYLMITSSVLNSSPKEEIKEYVNTWSTRYNVSLNLIEDIYNSFSYGIPHPLAVRKFCKYILENSPNNKPQYLLLLGRGYDMRFNRGVENYALVGNYQFNHIPAIGTPVSDNFYTSGLDGTADEPAIPTGRIPANTSDEIGHYLFKLRGYLNTYSTYDPWQKDVLHLSGGGSASQAFIIKGKLKYLEKYPIGDPFAGRVFSYGKSAGGTVDVNFRTTIQNHISNGVNLVSFLGHGSPTVTDIDVGNPDDYNNLNKYPICYFNGCQVGNVCVPLPYNLRGMGEKMFRAQKRGAIAFIGQTTTSELFTVSRQMEYFYKQYFDSVPDKTIGKVIKYSIKNFQIPNSELTRMHCQTLFLSGDPALPIFYPALPDFAVNNTSIFLDPPNAIALQDSFRVGVIISNLGKGVKDSFTVQLGRIYPDISTKRSYSQKVKLTGLVDTVYFVIRSKDKAAAGDNTFNVGLNDEKNPVEYTYDNNYATTKFYMPANGLNLITPSRFAIVGTDSVEMVIQKSDLFKESDDFYVEIDTTPWFNSSLLQSRERDNSPITAGVIAQWKVRLPSLRDTQVYFWRARVNVAGNQGGNWSMRSFTYIKNHREGWMQNVHWQYEPGISSNDYSTLIVDSAENSLVFSKISKKIYIDCNYQKTSNLGIKETGFAGQDLNFGVCTGSGLVVMIWDKRSLSRIYVDRTKLEPSCQWGKAWKAFGYGDDYQLYYAFQMSDPLQRADFVKLINLMPDSTYATIYTRYHSDAQLWDQPVFDALHKIGCTSFDTLTNRTQDAMFVALGKKGWSPGVAREAVVHGGYVQLEAEMIGDADKGYMLSENIGPTNQYNSMIFRPVVSNDKSINETDEFTVDVLGIKADGSYDVIKSKERITNTSLNYIYTGKYRFIRLRANVEDLAGRTAPNLLNWRVTHDSVPEGTLYPDAKYQYEFHSDTLYEGDTFVLKVAFKNISKVKFRDSIKMNWSLSQKITREVLLSDTFKFTALGPDSFFVFKFKYPTLGLNGPYGLQLSVNTDYAQPEKTLVNNSSLINFYVLRDIMRPVLDVTFDGRHLISGDIVSANPVIAITSKDENKFLWQTDTSTFDVFIKKPGAADFTIVKPGTEAVFYPATNKNNQARI